MNAGIELHDSKVSAIVRSPGVLRILLEPAYVHRSAGRPGVDPGEGWVQSAELVFSEPRDTEQGACIGTLGDGRISSDAAHFENVLPLPFALSGEVQAHLDFTSGGVLNVNAAGLVCVLKGEARFVERYEG
jgi:hypothetical protein